MGGADGSAGNAHDVTVPSVARQCRRAPVGDPPPAQAVRTVFNVAIGSDSPDVQRTARNALLQMLNTVIKRVMQAQLVRQRARARVAPKEARITACMRSCAAHLGGEDLGGCA